MLSVSNLSVQFGKRILFDEVNTKFQQGNCYGIIGANGAGKSTFLKILSGIQDPTSGQVHLEKGKRMSVLTQDHYAFDDFPVLETVVMGNKELFKIKKQIDDLYADYTDANAEKIGELQIIFEEMNGWNADSDAATMLSNLGISEDIHYTLMKDLDGKQKVRVLIAQALFGNPDVLIMDEPTNDLDFETIEWLENFIANFDNAMDNNRFIDTAPEVYDQLVSDIFDGVYENQTEIADAIEQLNLDPKLLSSTLELT